MRTLLLSCFAMLCAAIASAFGACDDPFDDVLCVYRLDDTQVDQLSTTDGAVSPFWSDWDGRDPWAEDAKTTNYWGDLLLPQDMGVVEPVTAVQHHPAAGRHQVTPQRSRQFTLQGKRVSSHNPLARGVTVCRRPSATGTVAALLLH